MGERGCGGHCENGGFFGMKNFLLLPVIGATTFFVFLFIYGKFGPGIPFSVNSIQTSKSDLFTVTGEGKASASPNMALATLGIQVKRPTVKDAQSQANSIINKVTGDVKALGIAAKDITTTNYSVYPDYNYQSGNHEITGYNVSVNVGVKVRDLDKVNDVVDRATADGANTVGGLQFTMDDELRAKLEDQARREAVRTAKEKATSLSSAAGITLGRIVNVQESSGGPAPIYRAEMMMAAPAGSGQTKVEPGTAEISLTVSLSYELR